MKPTVTVVVTLLNEADSLLMLLIALEQQTLQPSEVILVDGGSTDESWQMLQQWAQQHPKVKVWQMPGNRSVGRNFGISQATTELIAITDAGCVPDSDWLEQLMVAYRSGAVVAGYYRPAASTPLAAAAAAYALTPPQRLDSSTFLPATRSMLLPRSVWLAHGGFDEQLSDNEDYELSRRLAAAGVPMVFAEAAQVTWQPPTTLLAFFRMIFRFARGDARAGLRRLRVAAMFGRYIVAGLWLLAAIALLDIRLMIGWCSAFALYLFWAVAKNWHFAKAGWYWLPVMQLLSDWAVLLGSVAGWWSRKPSFTGS